MYKKYLIATGVFVGLGLLFKKSDTYKKIALQEPPINDLQHLPLVTSSRCMSKYGTPKYTIKSGYCYPYILTNYITTWQVPEALQVGNIPSKITCNKDMVKPLTDAFTRLITRGFYTEMTTFNGCICIRNKKGGSTWSLHSWGIAIDFNAATNDFGDTPTLSPGFVKCFTDSGFHWGGLWATPDGMHFQLSQI